MTLDMEVPLMPRYLTTPHHHHHHQQHPLKLLAGMGAFPPAVLAGDEDPASSPPSSTRDDSSRASSTSSPSSPGVVVSKPPRFSIADILKPDFGGHKATSKSPDQQEKEKNLFEGAVSPGDAHEKQFNTVKVQSVFKEQPLKDRLAFSATDLIGERDIRSSKQRNATGILPHGAFPPAGTKVPVAPHVGCVGPVPLPSFQGPAGLGGATMPPAAAAAYYQSYLSLCQQRYADYVQLYGGGGQHGLLPPSGPMPLAIPPFPTRPLPHGDHTRTAALFSPPPASPDCGSVQKQPSTSPAGDLHHRVQAASSTQHHSVTSQQQFSPTFPASGVHHQHSSSSKFQQHSSDDSQSRHSHVERRPKELSPSPPPSRGSVSSPTSQQHGAPQSPDSTSRESAGEAASESGKDGSAQQNLWPAWVYCTRYSDRPSSGPRSRKIRRKDKQVEEKRPRTAFTNDQLEYLRREFESNKYLTEERRQRLATELSLTESQIKIWFQNKRAKLKKSCGAKNPLALSLMAQGLYKHGGPGGEGDSGSNQSGADDMELDVDS